MKNNKKSTKNVKNVKNTRSTRNAAITASAAHVAGRTGRTGKTGTAGTTQATSTTRTTGTASTKNVRKWSEIRTLPLNALRIDAKYQRSLNLARVKYIVNNFDSDLVGTPQVSYRGGEYYVFDGQHTIKALSLLKRDSAFPIVCKVYYGLTAEEEALMYHKFNTSKTPINAISIIKAQAAYGDEKVKNFLESTKDAGFIIDPAKSRGCRYGIQAVRTAQNCFSSLGSENYKFMLKLLRAAWNGERWSITQYMLSGMELLTRVFLHELDDFAKRMSVFTDNDINKEAANFYDLSTPHRYAWALGTLFNKKGGKGSLDLKKLNFVNFA